MARRRSPDGLPDDFDPSGMIERFSDSEGGSFGAPGDVPMPPTDFSQQPTPDDAQIPGLLGGAEPPRGPINLPPTSGGAGNSERPREVFPDSAPRSPFMPPPAAPGDGIDLSLLPQGVEASAPPQSIEAAPQSTAMTPYSPAPMSERQGQPPASPGAVAPSTPARQPFSSPSAIFSAQGPRSIGGRSAGLTGGGLSMPGGPSGAPKPTEEMLQLLRAIGLGG